MDGTHDLGGRQGFGRVETDEPEGERFHSAWEARSYGLVRAMTRAPDWSIDWFRCCRELIAPSDYLTRPYYDQWLQTYAAMLVNSGMVTVDEVVTGKAASPASAGRPPMTGDFVRETGRKLSMDAERDTGATPQFKIGDGVLAARTGAAGHTRLPGYLRGRHGIIEACRGTHVLPDANALGEERAEPLYTVGFAAADLWPEAEGSSDRIFADLWESYLDPA